MITKVRYEAIWWSERFGTTDSMRFNDQKEALELARTYAKTTLTFLRRLTWIDGDIKIDQVKINEDGTWE